MKHSLINLNQSVHDPYESDPTRIMGIEISDDDLLSLCWQGSTVFFTSRYSNDDELKMYPHITVMCDKPWDPHGLIMPGGLDDTGHQTIQQVTSNVPHHMYETNCVLISIDGTPNNFLWNTWLSVYMSH